MASGISLSCFVFCLVFVRRHLDEKTTEMLEWVIIATLACVSSLFLIEILNTKKTEINGAHAVVRFETVSAISTETLETRMNRSQKLNLLW